MGFRISPGNPYNDMPDDDPAASFGPLLRAVDGLGLAYVHLIDMSPAFDARALVKANWTGPVILNNNLKADTARSALAAGAATAVAFGRAFISNPDLVERLRRGAALAKLDRTHLYGGDALGYTDYPALNLA